MIKVWHLDEERLLGNLQSWSEADPRFLAAKMGMREDDSQGQAAMSLKKDGFYRLVAEVETQDLEEAWEKTNNIDESWTLNAGVRSKVEHPRSSATGDIFERESGELFVCASIGFREIEIGPETEAKPKSRKP